MANKQREAYKTDKLKGRIIERFGTQKAFCKAIGMRPSTLCKALKDGRDWRGSTLIKAIRALDIPEAEVDAYFFDLGVEETQPRRAKR